MPLSLRFLLLLLCAVRVHLSTNERYGIFRNFSQATATHTSTTFSQHPEITTTYWYSVCASNFSFARSHNFIIAPCLPERRNYVVVANNEATTSYRFIAHIFLEHMKMHYWWIALNILRLTLYYKCTSGGAGSQSCKQLKISKNFQTETRYLVLAWCRQNAAGNDIDGRNVVLLLLPLLLSVVAGRMMVFHLLLSVSLSLPLSHTQLITKQVLPGKIQNISMIQVRSIWFHAIQFYAHNFSSFHRLYLSSRTTIVHRTTLQQKVLHHHL